MVVVVIFHVKEGAVRIGLGAAVSPIEKVKLNVVSHHLVGQVSQLLVQALYV